MTEDFENSVLLETNAFNVLVQQFISGASTTSTTGRRRLVAKFGLSVTEMAILWVKMEKLFGQETIGDDRERLLWALHWLYCYPVDEQAVAMFRPSPNEKTFRKWTHLYVKLFGELNLVCEGKKNLSGWQRACPCDCTLIMFFYTQRYNGNRDSKIGRSQFRRSPLTAPTATSTTRCVVGKMTSASASSLSNTNILLSDTGFACTSTSPS